MKKLRWYGWLTAAVLTVALTAQPRPVVAQDCDAVVNDEAHIFGDRQADVEAAANKLIAAGADVRIVTVSSLGQYGTLDQLKTARRKECLSWQSPNGLTKNNLIVLMVSMREHKSGIYCGDMYLPRLTEDVMARIRTERLNPALKAGDFAGAFIGAMDAIGDVITISPPAAAAPTPIVVNVPPNNTPPADLTGLWKVLGWGLGLLFISLLTFLGLATFQKNQRERERRKAAQLRAQRAQRGCAAIINELSEPDSPLTMIPIKLTDQGKRASAEMLAGVVELWRLNKPVFEQLKAQFASFKSTTNDPDVDGRSVEEYDQMSSAYEPLLKNLTKAKTTLAEISEQLDSLKRRLDGAPDALAAAGRALETATAEVGRVSELGFRTASAQQRLTNAAEALEQGRKALVSNDFSGALLGADKVTTMATQALKEAESLQRTKMELDLKLADLRTRITGVDKVIAEGRGAFVSLSNEYAASLWETVSGNGTEAEKRMAAVRAMVEPISSAITMEQQQWDTATKQLVIANKVLDDVEGLIRSITELLKNLESARADSPKELDAATKDLATATDYERQYDADIDDSVKDRLAAARTMIEDARRELAKPKPDYLSVLKLARRAHQAADAILDDERNEHEAAERLRQKADSRLRDANLSVSRATEYIDDHKKDSKPATKSRLSNAMANLAKAQAARDPQSIIAAAEAAINDAEDALGKAKSDHRHAEAQREAVRRRNDDDSVGSFVTGAVVGSLLSGSSSPHHHDYGSWGTPSGGGSGTIDIGGGGDGGGSSGAFNIGGGGDGGGSSGSW